MSRSRALGGEGLCPEIPGVRGHPGEGVRDRAEIWGPLGGPEDGGMAWGHPGIRVPKKTGWWGRMSCMGLREHEWAS